MEKVIGNLSLSINCYGRENILGLEMGMFVVYQEMIKRIFVFLGEKRNGCKDC